MKFTALDSLYLPFFSEVCQTKGGGGLVLTLVAHAGDDEDDYRDDVRQHLIQLFYCEIHAAGDEDVQDIQAAEQERGDDADVRTPDREDDQRDGEPAAVAERVVRPDAAGMTNAVPTSRRH